MMSKDSLELVPKLGESSKILIDNGLGTDGMGWS